MLVLRPSRIDLMIPFVLPPDPHPLVSFSFDGFYSKLCKIQDAVTKCIQWGPFAACNSVPRKDWINHDLVDSRTCTCVYN